MTREVFGYGHHPLGLESAGIGDGFGRDVVEPLPERPFADDRVAGVAVDVEHRGKVDLNAHAAALAAHGASIFIEQGVVLDSPQHHVHRESGRVGEAHGQPPLTVEGDEQRHPGQRLAVVGECALVGGGADIEEEAANFQLLHEPFQRLAVLRRIAVAHGDDEQLGDALVGGEGVEYRVGPLLHFLRVGLLQQMRFDRLDRQEPENQEYRRADNRVFHIALLRFSRGDAHFVQRRNGAFGLSRFFDVVDDHVAQEGGAVFPLGSLQTRGHVVAAVGHVVDGGYRVDAVVVEGGAVDGEVGGFVVGYGHAHLVAYGLAASRGDDVEEVAQVAPLQFNEAQRVVEGEYRVDFAEGDFALHQRVADAADVGDGQVDRLPEYRRSLALDDVGREVGQQRAGPFGSHVLARGAYDDAHHAVDARFVFAHDSLHLGLGSPVPVGIDGNQSGGDVKFGS